MQRGITLASLLTRIALGALVLLPVGAVLFPVYTTCHRCGLWRASSINNLHQLSQAINLYADAHGTLPPMESPEALRAALVPNQVKEAPEAAGTRQSVFVEPKSGQPFIPNPALSRRKPGDLEHPSETVVLLHPQQSDSPVAPVIVLYLDGSVKLIPWSDFAWMPPAK